LNQRRCAGFLSVVAIVGLTAVAAAHDPIRTRVTWNGDIARIVEARCVSCHDADARGTMSLASYEAARPWARAIKEEVLTRRMPKWQAARGYGSFSNDPSLSPFQIALVVAWADGGAPRGTEAEAKAAPAQTALVAAPRNSSHVRDIRMACGDERAPTGTLLAFRPELEPRHSVGVAITLPDGRREIIGWIRDYDDSAPTTYRLRSPLRIPDGSTITAEATGACALTLTVEESR
jgi:hypothetical protein